MHLRQQTLIVAVALACAGSSGCARLLGTLIAPQQAGMAAAGQVANTVSAPARGQLGGVANEVDRLLASNPGNRAELERISQELERRQQAERGGSGVSAQSDPQRLQPWHPRVVDKQAHIRTLQSGNPLASGDQLRLDARSAPERGLAARGPLPDGVPAAELRQPMQLMQFRRYPR